MPFTLGPIFNNQNGKVREWSITISLFDKTDCDVFISKDLNETTIKEGYYATYASCSGYTGMKMTTATPTIISVGKNLGKKNETSVLTQAYNECLSKYNSKLKAGYTERNTINPSTLQLPAIPIPMAVKTWKDFKHKLEYPLFVQPKLDGVRMLARFEDGEVKLTTRRRHDIIGFAAIKETLTKMFEASHMRTFIIDGELYLHGMSLQAISGLVRNVSIDESEKAKLEYHVFDCFDVNQSSLPFKTRLGLTKTFISSVKSSNVILNPTTKVESEEVADELYKEYVKQSYEGIIYKSSNHPYEFDFNKENRSMWYLKRKNQDDAEFAIVGFSQGKGKNLGCIVFELQGPNNKTFNCVPNGTYDYLKELYTQAVAAFDTTFKDKMAKVVYDDLSKDDIPLRGRIVQIGRDLSFD